VREFQAKGQAVISAPLGPSAATDLKTTGAERLALDVADPASIAALAATLRGRPVDILIDNAGLGERADMPRLDYDRFKELLRVNTTAPIRGLNGPAHAEPCRREKQESGGALQAARIDSEHRHEFLPRLTRFKGRPEHVHGHGGPYASRAGYRVACAASRLGGRPTWAERVRRLSPQTALRVSKR